MKSYFDMDKAGLVREQEHIQTELAEYAKMRLKLNMARGKPGAEQLALSMPLLDVVNSDSDFTSDRTDCRNYGELTGIGEAKRLFAEYMGVAENEIIVTGSSSLTTMYDCMTRAMLKGVLESNAPWSGQNIKFICPVPGYDRHFTICEFLGIEMISVPMDESGPDMAMVERLTSNDASIKGMWCVPKYSNPLGTTYSDETVRRIAAFTPKAKDFRVFWDNAYAMHSVYKDTMVLNLLEECKKVGNPDRAYMFGSTSKITFPGAGVAFFAASRANIEFAEKQLAAQAISWDKLNMLRHVRFLKDASGIRTQMEKHAALLRPRFNIVLGMLEKELLGCGAGRWIRPDGGYFVAFMANKGCAKRIVALCGETGVTLTAAGATHPYCKDPNDEYIRIAPSYPSLDELQTAMKIFCCCARLAAVEKLIETA